MQGLGFEPGHHKKKKTAAAVEDPHPKIQKEKTNAQCKLDLIALFALRCSKVFWIYMIVTFDCTKSMESYGSIIVLFGSECNF